MSHEQQTAGGYSSHSDRVAQRDPCMCAAYGCPMIGTSTTSTLGASEWFCWLHFGKDASQWHRITAELHRLGWLCEIVTSVRKNYGGPGWPDTWRKVVQSITLNQRGDLQKLDDSKESMRVWLARVEKVLDEACYEVTKAPVRQARIEAADTWSKVGFDLPETA